MFVAMSRFTVKNGMEAQVREAFRQRPHYVDSAPGFIRMEVMNPEDKPEEFVLVTHWQDKASWEVWYRGHTYREAHQGIPKGLKLVPQATEISFFNLLCN